ncbi:MAG: HD domain-containing protein [Candidatus Coatesbacteria bacterium]|nr:HD domain-containing protein [Candidatus Coatesbacteria bacterium]
MNETGNKIIAFIEKNTSINGFKPCINRFEEDLAIIEKEAMPFHILRHSLCVSLIGIYLGVNFNRKKKRNVDLQLIFSGGLLHDIAKSASINGSIKERSHADYGREILEKYDRFREAEIASMHLIQHFVNFKLSNESCIVNVADKTVIHDRILSIEERFEDLKKRYPDFLPLFNFEIMKRYKEFFTKYSDENWEEYRMLLNNEIKSL